MDLALWAGQLHQNNRSIICTFTPLCPCPQGEEIKKSIVLNARGVQNYAEKNYFSPSLRL
jgi:hypothetical protein